MTAPAFHACFSGSLACSGVNPCDACFQVIRSVVLPRAMIRGGFNQDEAQARSFFAGFGEGFEVLHRQIEANPSMVGLHDVGAVQALYAGQTLNAAVPVGPQPAAMVLEENLPPDADLTETPLTAEQEAERLRVSSPAATTLPAPPEDDGTLLGPDKDLMGPLSKDELKTLMDKAARMTDPVQVTEAEEPPSHEPENEHSAADPHGE